MNLLRFRATAGLLFGLLFTYASAGAAKVPPQEQGKKPASKGAAAAQKEVSVEEKQRRKEWSDGMLRKAAPKKGCFTADYPSTEWKEVRCVR